MSDRDQPSACEADDAGFVVRDGVRIHWERYGDGDRAILLPSCRALHAPTDCRGIDGGGARRAAALIAELL